MSAVLDTNAPFLAAAARLNPAGGGPGRHRQEPMFDQEARLWRIACWPTIAARPTSSDDTTDEKE